MDYIEDDASEAEAHGAKRFVAGLRAQLVTDQSENENAGQPQEGHTNSSLNKDNFVHYEFVDGDGICYGLTSDDGNDGGWARDQRVRQRNSSSTSPQDYPAPVDSEAGASSSCPEIREGSSVKAFTKFIEKHVKQHRRRQDRSNSRSVSRVPSKKRR